MAQVRSTSILLNLIPNDGPSKLTNSPTFQVAILKKVYVIAFWVLILRRLKQMRFTINVLS